MALVGVDWSVDNITAYLLDSSGRLLEVLDKSRPEKTSNDDGTAANAEELDSLLHTGKSPLWREKDTLVLLCGMAGSRNGWKQLPDVLTPACSRKVVVGASSHQLKDGRQALIVPGVAHQTFEGGVAEKVWGESILSFGAFESEDVGRLVVVPGRQCKWLRGGATGITSFQTQMSGEVFSMMKLCGVVGEVEESASDHVDAFEAGLGRYCSEGELLKFLASCQQDGRHMKPEALSSYVSGVIIGYELRNACGDGKQIGIPNSTTIVTNDALCASRYRRAFKTLFSIEVNIISIKDAAAAGMMKIWQEVKRSQGMVRATETFFKALKECPVVAILRGVKPEEVVGVGKAMVEAGVRIVEVPMNSPEALRSVKLLAEALPPHVAVGAGTVLTPEQAQGVAEAGGTLVISPNADEDVIRRTKELGLISLPGVATPTEAFAALKWGADGLKAFPGEQLPPKVLKAWRAVLPKDCCLLAVGGVTPETMANYWAIGVNGFGIGSNIYSPGDGPEAALEKAKAFVAATNALEQNGDTKPAEGSTKLVVDFPPRV
eukprot:TRINITY_DN13149_c0_g1_i1.p1 TRINITY_DN13149_c0_g1~~TRINITY_DN13149_c0_g1_i1.p1  ORF type:complete len:547 (+),score=122.46 TRINITY_DN13149_c0_g1_i1:94-1734(+)